MAGARQSSVTSAEPLDDARVLVVEARYYDDLADELLSGALAVLKAAGVTATVATVPGALEIPATVAIMVEAASAHGAPFDAVVALGTVIRGETYHFEIVAGESARALMDLSVAYGMPLGNGILTVENDEQAWARARVSEGNKGGGAADAALSVLRIKRQAIAGAV